MATKESPPPGLLASFKQPLWERLRLEDPKPLWIVRSRHRNHEWMAIELEHRSYGVFSDGSSSRDTTTIFVLPLPAHPDGWFLPAGHMAAHRQICVDSGHLYLAAVGQSPRVRDWPRWLDTAADAVDGLVRSRGTGGQAPRSAQAEADDGDSDEVSWNPHDGRWVMLWMVLTVPLALLLLAVAMAFYKEWAGTGAIAHCNPATHMGHRLQGWQAQVYLGLFAVPLLGWGRLLHTVATRMHRPGFVLRLNLEGVALAGLSLLALFLQQTLAGWARGAC